MFYNVPKFLESNYSKYLTEKQKQDLLLLTKIFPFKVSHYVLEQLIHWDNIKSDPIYRLTFPEKEMLSQEHWEMLSAANGIKEQNDAVNKIRRSLNPNPAGQIHNIPRIGDRLFEGIQHKYRETALFFPAEGQTCHSYCSYCFRWAQFVNLKDEHKFKSKNQQDLYDYLERHKEVSDVLFTGGDPMFMKNEKLFDYMDVLLLPELEHIQSIRIGTKSLAFHPDRYLGKEGDAFLKKIEQIVDQRKNVALMAHFSHYRELQTEKVEKAIRRLRDAGVTIRTQAPLVKGINSTAHVWEEMWKQSVQMGMIPYYMFVERDTGAHAYFAVPLAEAYHIFTEAYSKVSGLAKTVRGPSMSASPGKVLVDGITTIQGKKKFILKFIQARNPQLINLPFFADYDDEATWLNELNIEEEMAKKIGLEVTPFDKQTAP
jgi:KamA family protein